MILNEKWIITHAGVMSNEKSARSCVHKILVFPKHPSNITWPMLISNSSPVTDYLPTLEGEVYSVEKTFCSTLDSNDMALLKLHKAIPLNKTFENFQAIAISKIVDWKNKTFIAESWGTRMFAIRYTEYTQTINMWDATFREGIRVELIFFI